MPSSQTETVSGLNGVLLPAKGRLVPMDLVPQGEDALRAGDIWFFSFFWFL